MIIQWQSEGLTVLPVQVTPNVHIRNMYISDTQLTYFVNRIECKINKDFFTKVVNQKVPLKYVTPFPVNLANLVLNELDTKELFITIPLFNLKRIDVTGVSNSHEFHTLIGDSIITSYDPYKLIGLPTFSFIINGEKVETPCSICPNNPIVPGFCLKYEDQYACLFACGIPEQEQENRRLSLILSGVDSEDLQKLDEVDYNYDKYVEEYFQEYINREEDYND